VGPLRSSPHSFVTDYNLHSSAQYKVSLSVSYRDSSAGVSRVATAGRGRGGGRGPGLGFTIPASSIVRVHVCTVLATMRATKLSFTLPMPSSCEPGGDALEP
jgi:hypothetical protein